MTQAHEDLLHRAGLRVTRPRSAVLRALASQPHADSGAVLEAARLAAGKVSRQAIFDSLNTLVDVGVVRRIQPAGSSARYELRVGDNHHHLVCRSCAAVVDVDCAVGDAPCLDAAEDHGYTIDEAEVIYWGTCPACRAPTR